MRILIRPERCPQAVAPRLAVLFAIALCLRLSGIAFGLPYVFHADEPTHVGEALGLIHGATDALSFANPPLYKYFLVGLFGSVVGFQRLAEVGEAPLFLIARASSAIFGAFTVLAVYWLARLVRGQSAGLIAAGLTAVTFLLVRESHFAVNDALATLLTTVSLACSVRVACRGTRGDYVFAGAALGLAFAAKYQAAAVLVPLALAHVQHGRRRRDVDMLIALGVALVTAVVAFPPMVTEARRVAGDIWVDIVLPSRLGWPGLDPVGGYVYYVDVLKWGIGWPMLAAAGLGVGWALVRRSWPVLIVASLPVAMYAVMGGSHIYFARYLLPAMPPLIVVAATGLDALTRRSTLLSVVLTVVVLAWTLPNSLRFDLLLTRPDTRTDARMWIQSHLSPGAHVAAERVAVGPPLSDLPLDVVYPSGNEIFNSSLDDYRHQGVEYVVTSSYTAEEATPDPARNAQRLAFYAALSSEAEQLVEFRPYHGEEPKFLFDRGYGPFDSLDQFDQPGPTITIYRLLRS
jgi:hypothetical protein